MPLFDSKTSITTDKMSEDNLSLIDIIKSLPDGPGWGPPVTSETMLNGVPYAPYSKGDKLGKMADWTSDSKDGRDGRGGRGQYNRNYRGMFSRRRLDRRANVS